jgi:hypothetical protein
MSFRERISHQPEWDPDEDAAPPVWNDRTSSAQSSGKLAGELPTWPRGESLHDHPNEDSYVPLPPPRPRRTTSDTPDRRNSSWPNLRDSLKGSSSAASSGARTGRRASTFNSPPANQTRTGSFPTPDRYDDELPWPIPDDAPYEPAPTATEDQRYPIRRGSTSRARPRPRRAAQTHNRPSLQLPAALATIAAAQDRSVLAAVGGSAFSLLLMVATVSSRSDSLPTWFAIHVNAAGHADRWATASTVWRLPLMTAVLTLATFVGAMFVARRDPFASKFLLVSALLIHALAWIGLVRILW